MLSSLFGGKNYRFKQTFTYYIPAPPVRKTGYHEKEFDIITKHILEMGFELLDIKMQSHSTHEASGVWVVCLLGTNDSAIAERKIEIDFTQIANGSSSTEHPMDPDIIHEI
ncbi:MAG: hypothetical protein VYA54_01125 [Bdellovibrionota bacterium]|nr:hypothetical protein [Bdellovibrionota bacterium]